MKRAQPISIARQHDLMRELRVARWKPQSNFSKAEDISVGVDVHDFSRQRYGKRCVVPQADSSSLPVRAQHVQFMRTLSPSRTSIISFVLYFQWLMHWEPTQLLISSMVRIWKDLNYFPCAGKFKHSGAWKCFFPYHQAQLDWQLWKQLEGGRHVSDRLIQVLRMLLCLFRHVVAEHQQGQDE